MLALCKSKMILAFPNKIKLFSTLTTSEYHVLADSTLHMLSDSVGTLEDQLNDIDINFTVWYTI